MSIDGSRQDERRAETRRPADGGVKLWLNGSALTVPGHLVDIARSGFRARHRLPALCPGHTVEFEFAGVRGRARVVWTRILGEHIESGFLILREDAG
jgi:hypothetical protein